MRVRPLVIPLLAALAAGCGDAASEAAYPGFSPPAGAAPDVYRGLFPCDDCPGIDTTLWLRSDNAFFWRQEYLDDAGEPSLTTYNLGLWHIDDEGRVVLRGSGPPRRLEAAGADALLLQTPSGAEHRLYRDPGAPPFTDRIRFEGLARVESGTTRISECRTGLSGPAGGGDLRRFERQYRSLGYRGRPALVEVEARLEWSDDGALRGFAVDRFLTIRSDRAC